jgi:hypothetical protein
LKSTIVKIPYGGYTIHKGEKMNPESKEVTMMYAREVYVRCPYCDEQVGGWVGNPAGAETTCDECRMKFTVSVHADIEFEY